MNFASIKTVDVANGTGVRASLFVSGCRHHCPGCFNQEAWDFDYGEPFAEKQAEMLMKALEPDYISGLSLLGGEPLDPKNQPEVLKLARQVRARFPQKTIWCYTGYRFEDELLKMSEENAETAELLSLIDVLVDGRFELAQKQLGLRFRGSSNQRILDLPKSLAAKRALPLAGMD